MINRQSLNNSVNIAINRSPKIKAIKSTNAILSFEIINIHNILYELVLS